jgi:hypothetical protein
MTARRVYMLAVICSADDEGGLPTNVGLIEGIKDGLADEWFETDEDSFRIERIVTDAAWTVPAELADPYPVGTQVMVIDYDGSTLGPFEVVRSYWPETCVELLTENGMVRQNHDRMRRAQ